jgi:hypothetical protein
MHFGSIASICKTHEIMNDKQLPWWRNRQRWPFIVFGVIALYFLWTEHRAHVIEYLPLVLILACIGMHFFMHGGHGHGGHRDQEVDHDMQSRAGDEEERS